MQGAGDKHRERRARARAGGRADRGQPGPGGDPGGRKEEHGGSL